MEYTETNPKTEHAAQETSIRETWEQIESRRTARRHRRHRRWVLTTAAGMILAFGIGCMAGAATNGSPEPKATAPVVSAEVTAVEQPRSYTLPAGPIMPPEPEAEAAPAKLLEDIPLDIDTQQRIFKLCDRDPELFCAIMAIAEKESGFDPERVGDGGESIGMMQIHIESHPDRLERMGYTAEDMKDPVKGADVAIDCLKELSAEPYNFGWVQDNTLYMAYNMGPGRARTLIQEGTTSSVYSREVLAAAQAYMEEVQA